MKEHWLLDPAVTFLNHGSFGACPRRVLSHQQQLRDEMEREPCDFMSRKLAPLLLDARNRAAMFVGARAQDFVFVGNATQGVNAVLRSLSWSHGDELLTTDHGYLACRNALEYVAKRSGASVQVADLPFPASDSDSLYHAVMSRVTPRTRLALLDHVTSPSAMVLPIKRLTAELEDRGIEVLVDGAHAPGMLDFSVQEIGASYYTGNFHKWVCAPKGAAFLCVREDRQDKLVPTSVSVGATARLPGQSRFHALFDWTGTTDFTSWLSVPAALNFLDSLFPGGINEVRERNHQLALRARQHLTEVLGADACPGELLGSMVSIPVFGAGPDLSDDLFSQHRIEVPAKILTNGQCLVRVSAQVYNRPADFEALSAALLARPGLSFVNR